jgi:hypothetical protein
MATSQLNFVQKLNRTVLVKTLCLGFFLTASSLLLIQTQRQDAQAEYIYVANQADQQVLPGGDVGAGRVDAEIEDALKNINRNGVWIGGLARIVLAVGVVLIFGSLGVLMYMRSK